MYGTRTTEEVKNLLHHLEEMHLGFILCDQLEFIVRIKMNYIDGGEYNQYYNLGDNNWDITVDKL
jgi:hypothetical protein